MKKETKAVWKQLADKAVDAWWQTLTTEEKLAVFSENVVRKPTIGISTQVNPWGIYPIKPSKYKEVFPKPSNGTFI